MVAESVKKVLQDCRFHSQMHIKCISKQLRSGRMFFFVYCFCQLCAFTWNFTNGQRNLTYILERCGKWCAECCKASTYQACKKNFRIQNLKEHKLLNNIRSTGSRSFPERWGTIQKFQLQSIQELHFNSYLSNEERNWPLLIRRQCRPFPYLASCANLCSFTGLQQ